MNSSNNKKTEECKDCYGIKPCNKHFVMSSSSLPEVKEPIGKITLDLDQYQTKILPAPQEQKCDCGFPNMRHKKGCAYGTHILEKIIEQEAPTVEEKKLGRPVGCIRKEIEETNPELIQEIENDPEFQKERAENLAGLPTEQEGDI